MPHDVSTFIFDFGGVIFHNPQHPEMTKVEHDEIWAAIASLAEDFQLELQAGTFTFVRFTQLFRERTPNVREFLREHVFSSVGSPNQEVIALIDDYHQHYQIFGLVNASPGWTELRRGINGLDRHFTRVLASHEVRVRKPDPQIFIHALAMVDRPAPYCCFIDDQPENVAAAKELGFQTHLFTDVPRLREFLSSVVGA